MTAARIQHHLLPQNHPKLLDKVHQTPDTEKDDLPISSRLSDGTATTNKSLPATDISETAETYNKFKEEQELKLEKWLRESEEAGGDGD